MGLLNQNIAVAGFILVVIGMVLMVAGSIQGAKVESAGLVLIGPFPIVWGSDTKLLIPVLILTIAIILLVWLLGLQH
ncbi:MAG: DUF131 domain-containing protein [Candidatus Diapherotrites archaeon]|nr:DUF131 domain-containing protein [Candidatus Diapherotrites archaeon]